MLRRMVCVFLVWFVHGVASPQKLAVDHDRKLPREEDEFEGHPPSGAARFRDGGHHLRLQRQAVPDVAESSDRAEHDQDRGGQDHRHLQGGRYRGRQFGRRCESCMRICVCVFLCFVFLCSAAVGLVFCFFSVAGIYTRCHTTDCSDAALFFELGLIKYACTFGKQYAILEGEN